MKDADRQTRSYLMELFAQHGFHPRTMLGQNFLIDLNIIEYIANKAKIDENDVVLEVGAGTGGLTTFLAQHAAHVISVEIDSNMFQLAQSTTADFNNITLLNQDALRNKNHLADNVLEMIKEQLAVDPQRRLKLVSNLPYSVATPIISNLVATDLPWKRMVITIQWELGLRMVAEPAGNHYGSLSIWLQSQCHVKLLKRLAPTVFWPRPAVESAIMLLTPNQWGRKKIENRAFLHDFIRRLFHQRRKFARSVLVGMYRKQLTKTQIDDVLTSMKLKENPRAEELPVGKLVELSNRICRAIKRVETVENAVENIDIDPPEKK